MGAYASSHESLAARAARVAQRPERWGDDAASARAFIIYDARNLVAAISLSS